MSAFCLQAGFITTVVSSVYLLVTPKIINVILNPTAIAAEPLTSTVVYVDQNTGIDNVHSGTTPYKTITFALTQVTPGTTIQLAPGTYSKESGETFPLKLQSGVTLQGNVSTQGKDILIKGGGNYISRFFAKQNITIFTEDATVIRGITITNPQTRGTGVWVESTNPTIQSNTFTHSLREGIFITGTGDPEIMNNIFVKNEGNGISVTKSAQGKIYNNSFQSTGFGLAIGGNSQPLVTENKITENKDGIFISESAKPVLRNNIIENNQQDGIVVIGKALPDLGNNTSPGGNVIRKNKRYDLNIGTEQHLIVSVGNDIGKVKTSTQTANKSQKTKSKARTK